MKRFPRKVLSVLSNFPLAIGEMFNVAALMALGIAIDQEDRISCTLLKPFASQNFQNLCPKHQFKIRVLCDGSWI